MKKILIVTTIAGFLPQFEMNDVEILQSLGYEVHYASNFDVTVYSFDASSLKKKGIILHQTDIVKSPLGIVNNNKAIKQIKKIIDEENIDIVHCHNPMGGADGRVAARLSKKRPFVIYTAHGFHFYKGAPLKNWLIYYPIEKILSRWTDAIITINEEDYERALKFPTGKKNGVYRIHGVGVNSERFKADPEKRKAMRKELNIPDDAFHIVTAAELNDNKNQTVVIEAIKNIARDDVYYSLCGEGPNENSLKELIEKYGLSDRVRLLGYRTDIEDVLQSADCFAFPSKREGLGIAAVEALLTGVPLIASDNRGTREYAIDGKNGFVCDAGSVSDFEEAITKMLDNKDIRDKMTSYARESAAEFCLGEVGKVMRKVYEDANNYVLEKQGKE
ncbi:MAG: glycosyltransferase family 4 protein [Lachnospiraceae bacterium]|nr:glycosyltransferase family 4 protein [Lachnospiraceae bacterium]